MAAVDGAGPAKTRQSAGSPERMAPGELLHRLLMRSDASGRSTRLSCNRCPGRSWSRSRSRSPSHSPSQPSSVRSASPPPQPKKMPTMKAQPKASFLLVPKPKHGPLAQREVGDRKLEDHQAFLAKAKSNLRPEAPKLMLTVPKHAAKAAAAGSWWRRMDLRLASCPKSPATPREERRCLEVLARHTARLGAAGPGLERAVWEAFVAADRAAKAQRQTAASTALSQRWAFLVSETGFADYVRERARFAEVYKKSTKSQADRTVREMFTSGPSDGPSPRPLPPVEQAPAYRNPPLGLLEVPIAGLRFAHNDQSELFAHNDRGNDLQSILQLAVELLAGATKPEDVTMFDVCVHEGLWYCRTGHRRLAAFRLVHRWSSGRVRRVRAKAVNVDNIFIKGSSSSGRPKFTTHLNGRDCKGRWLAIKETGESVGREEPGREEYGADLMALLAPPPPPPCPWKTEPGVTRGGG